MWTLIIVASMFSSPGGYPVSVTVHSVTDFNTKDACTTAGDSLPKPKHAERDESAIEFVCVWRQS